MRLLIRHIGLLGLMCSMCLLTGCGISTEDADKMAKEEFERKKAEFISERREVCLKEANLQAEIIADSLIRSMDLNPLKENQYRPQAPPRPDYIPVDSSVFNSKRSVKPISKTPSNKR